MKTCEVCGKPIKVGDAFISHRYFGDKHVACLDKALDMAREEIVNIDKEIKELDKL